MEATQTDQDLALARAAISACADPAIEAVEADRREEAQAQAAAALISVIALEESCLRGTPYTCPFV